MALSNKDNITKRIDVDRRLTYIEMDENFEQLKVAITDIHDFIPLLDAKLEQSVYDAKMIDIDSSILALEQELTQVVSEQYVTNLANTVLYQPGSGVAGAAGTAALNNTEDFDSAGTAGQAVVDHVNELDPHDQYLLKSDDLNSVDAAAARNNLDVVKSSDVSLPTIVRKTSDNGAAVLPAGTTLQRPTGPGPYFRRNTELGTWEGSADGITWGSIGGGATGAGGNAVFVENDQVVTGDYTIPSNKNASTVGPITIADGVTVTISDGARWVIL